MADEFLGGAAVGAVFGELLKVVIDAGKKLTMFESELQYIESSLVYIKPMVEDIEKSNRLLGRPEEETTMFVDRLREAKELVLKCSTIDTWNPCKRIKYTKKLIKLEKSLLGFFQMEVQGQLIFDSKKILVELRDISYKLDQMLPMFNNGGRFAGLCVVLELRDHIVGLDKQLRELKEMVQKEGRPKQQNGIFGDIFFATVLKTANLMCIVSKLFEHKGIHPRDKSLKRMKMQSDN